jgi:hypothetical protein
MDKRKLVLSTINCYLFCLVFSSCSGGGTLGSSSSGGVTIKGQAKFSGTNAPVSNSSMRVLTIDGSTEIAKSETNSSGEFKMILEKSDESIILDIEKATTGVQMDSALLTLDEVRLTILEEVGISTDIKNYLGLGIEIKGDCRLTKDPITSKISINLNAENAVCSIKLFGLMRGAIENTSARLSKCDQVVTEISHEEEKEILLTSADASCPKNDLTVEYEGLIIEVGIY